MAVNSTSPETNESLSTLDEASSNRSEAESLKALYERFQQGDAVTGTVIKHSKMTPVLPMLTRLVARKVKASCTSTR